MHVSGIEPSIAGQNRAQTSAEIGVVAPGSISLGVAHAVPVVSFHKRLTEHAVAPNGPGHVAATSLVSAASVTAGTSTEMVTSGAVTVSLAS